MIEAQTTDMMICPSEGGIPCSAWQLTAEASAEVAVNCQAERSILPKDLQIIRSDVYARIIDFFFIAKN